MCHSPFAPLVTLLFHNRSTVLQAQDGTTAICRKVEVSANNMKQPSLFEHQTVFESGYGNRLIASPANSLKKIIRVNVTAESKREAESVYGNLVAIQECLLFD